MKKILLVYATREGQTEKIAKTLLGYLSSFDCDVTIKNIADEENQSLDLQHFDTLVFGASIHIGNIEKEMAAFIKHHKDIIDIKPAYLFVVSMSVACRDQARREKSLNDIRDKLEKQLGFHFPDIEMIAGALSYTKYNWLEKQVMRRIAEKEGGSTDTSKDHEYTDWDQVAAYSRRLTV